MQALLTSPSLLFLVVIAVFSTLTLALPMILAPLAWARVLRWKLPAESDLAVYFGRCLGCVILGQALLALHAASHPPLMRPMYALLCFNFGAMVAVHLWGAWRGIQPATENWETLAWAALLALGLWLFP